MKKYIVIIFLLFSVILNAQDKCYLWGFVGSINDQTSEWRYVEMTKNSENIFECTVNITGGFYVMLNNSADMSNASWENVFKMFGYVAYDRYNATFYHSYDAWYPMKKLTDWPDTEWIMFNPPVGMYKCYVDLNNSLPVISLVKYNSAVEDIEYFNPYFNKYTDIVYNIYGQDVSSKWLNKEPGIYIINKKKVILW